MDWHYFGHAMWLVDLGAVRVLFDPLLEGVHHGGVFEVDPARTIDVEALRPDFIVVSHRHADHFDIPSLRRLAALDPDAVIFTADDLVADAAHALGFRTISRVETLSRVEIEGARLVATPSYSDDVEWGLLVDTHDGVAWNQIDSFHPDAARVRETLALASKVLARDVTDGLPLALARWQPVLETSATFADDPGFPFREYALALDRIAAIGAKAVVPSAAGVCHTNPYAFMNHYVYPVPQRRVLRDLVARVPTLTVFPATVGATYRVRDGRASFDPSGARAWVDPRDEDPASTVFRPYEMPALCDPNPSRLDEGAMRATVARWIERDLADGLARAYGSMRANGTLRFVVECVFPAARDAFTLAVGAHGATVTREFDDDYDALCTIAGSLLCDVIEGRRAWGDPMLAGMLRSVRRAYHVDARGLIAAKIDATFLFHGLAYDDSVRRAVAWQLAHP